MRLKEIRKQKGMTAEEVGREIGVTQAAIANWENNRRIMNVDTLVRLSQVLGCTPNDLLGFETHRTEEPACRAQ